MKQVQQVFQMKIKQALNQLFNTLKTLTIPQIITFVKNNYQKILLYGKVIAVFFIFFVMLIIMKIKKKMRQNKMQKPNNKKKNKSRLSLKHYVSQSQSDSHSNESELQKPQQKQQATRYDTDIQTDKQNYPKQSVVEKKRDEFFFNVIQKYREETAFEDQEVEYSEYSGQVSDRKCEMKLDFEGQDNEDYWTHPTKTK